MNSNKGIAYFEKVKDKLEWEETKFESILPGNIALRKPIEPSRIDRKTFFEDLDRGIDASSINKEVVNGYHICKAVVLGKEQKQPISLYSEIYS